VHPAASSQKARRNAGFRIGMAGATRDADMSNALSIALSAQTALRRQMEVVANNVANSSTPAFKGQRMVFAQWLMKEPSADPVAFVQDWGTSRDVRQGGLTHTGNSLDLALQGSGYFSVETPQGVRFTRNGRLMLDAERQLVNSAGYPVLGEGDQPIAIPPEAAEITVAHDGTISTEAGAVGRIQVARFERESDLLPASDGTYITNAPAQPAEGTKVLQGMIEESNVQPIVEITRMMEVSQRYNSAKEMLDGEHERLKLAIERLARVA
jgi:flagellar basal-body rod protein FlgF